MPKHYKVRELIKMIEADGWYQVAQVGSHRQYKHPARPGRVTIAGKPGYEPPRAVVNSILETSGITLSSPPETEIRMRRYLIIIEPPDHEGGSYGAYAPDLPGCVAAGESEEEVIDLMAEAITLHVRGMVEDGEPIPTSTARAVELVLPDPLSRRSAA